MNQVKQDLLLHPVRVRILLAAAGRQVTAQQLADELRDIPQATLYRNINKLAAAGMLAVVGERRVRNTVEKTYTLPTQGPMLTAEDMKGARTEDYNRLATLYFGNLLGYFLRYVGRGNVDPAHDNVLLQAFPAYLSDAEIQELGRAWTAALRPYLKNEESPERRRYIFGLTSIPDIAGEPPAAPRTRRKTPRQSKRGRKNGHRG